MRRRSEIFYKLIIIILITIIIIFSLLNRSNYCELNNTTIVNKFIPEKKIENKIPFNKEVLYVSRHAGTISNFNSIAQRLSLNVTLLEPSYDFHEKPNCYGTDECKSFVELMCSQYDYIVISDIIPDSYIYLTNPCNTKIILEITNRFNLFVIPENEEDYYRKFAKAISENKNLVVVENNPYEVYHACLYQVFIPNYYLIRPIGVAPPEVLQEEHNEVHEEVAVIDHSDHDSQMTIPNLIKYGVKYKKLNSKYGGPLVLATYKAVIMLPYQVSIMKMMENFKYGVAMIIPTERLFKTLAVEEIYNFTEKELLDVPGAIEKYIEFYNEEFREFFVYFDKWEDLPEIIEKTDFDSLKIKEKKFMEKYEKYAINTWAEVFGIIPQKHLITDKKPLCDVTEFLNYNNDDQDKE